MPRAALGIIEQEKENLMINESSYNSEKELQDWVFFNINTFMPAGNLLNGFQITTASGKNGVPDGFAFDFENKEWYLIECELLSHGVWPHIAEQITRFVVAAKNPDTLRKIRDRQVAPSSSVFYFAIAAVMLKGLNVH